MIHHKTNMIIAILLTFGMANAHTTGRFHTHSSDYKIYGPNGSQFVPKGVNAVSYGFDWSLESYDLMLPDKPIEGTKYPRWQIITDLWKVNTVRFALFYYPHAEPHYSWQHQLDIFEKFLKRGIVCMLSQNDLLLDSNKYYHQMHNPDISQIIARFNETVTYFEQRGYNSSYLWFNLNEPRGEDADLWQEECKRLIDGLRNANHDNIIVCDADREALDHPGLSGSFIRLDGQKIINYAQNKTGFSNIVFGFDTYSIIWNQGTKKDCINRYKKYFGDCRNGGVPVIINEQGYPIHEGNQAKVGHISGGETVTDNAIMALRYLFEKEKVNDIGILVWSINGKQLCRNGATGFQINQDGLKSKRPTNLTVLGGFLWDYLRSKRNENR
jgi:hypothetical protein